MSPTLERLVLCRMCLSGSIDTMSTVYYSQVLKSCPLWDWECPPVVVGPWSLPTCWWVGLAPRPAAYEVQLSLQWMHCWVGLILSPSVFEAWSYLLCMCWLTRLAPSMAIFKAWLEFRHVCWKRGAGPQPAWPRGLAMTTGGFLSDAGWAAPLRLL